MNRTHVLILAGGKGSRMKSDLPKVLHPVKGIPIIHRLLSAVTAVCERPTLIVGHQKDDVIAATDGKYHYVEQREQLGTGHAVMCAKDELRNAGIKALVVLPGDHPLVSEATVRKLVENHLASDAVVSLGTALVDRDDPRLLIFNNFGRIVRDAVGKVERIVEFKDATEDERNLNEFNLSYYCFDADWLWENLDKLGNANASKEYYLTDMIGIAKAQGRHVDSYAITNIPECLGVNTPEQLKMVEDAIDAAAAAALTPERAEV